MSDQPSRPNGATWPHGAGESSPGDGHGLTDDVAKEVQTGVSSADGDEHTGQQAPATEGYDELG
jgi:hypothetical protein